MTEQNTVTNKHKKTLMMLLILLIVIIATVIGVYYFGSRFSKETPSFSAAIAIKEIQSQLVQQQAVIQELQHQNEVQKQDVGKTKSWKPIAVEYLVRMADLTLNTSGDVKIALEFLSTAKKYTNDVEELAISHALNKDIASLQAVPIVDTEKLILEIDAVSQQVDSLPIIPSRSVVPTPALGSESHLQQMRLLKQFFANVVNALKDIVIIRHQTVEPVLPPEQVTNLRFNIQAKLLQAELAVMQRQNKIYQTCLTQVIGLITKYFVGNNSAAANVLRALQQLQQIDLQPNLPLLTESLMAIQSLKS